MGRRSSGDIRWHWEDRTLGRRGGSAMAEREAAVRIPPMGPPSPPRLCLGSGSLRARSLLSASEPGRGSPRRDWTPKNGVVPGGDPRSRGPLLRRRAPAEQRCCPCAQTRPEPGGSQAERVRTVRGCSTARSTPTTASTTTPTARPAAQTLSSGSRGPRTGDRVGRARGADGQDLPAAEGRPLRGTGLREGAPGSPRISQLPGPRGRFWGPDKAGSREPQGPPSSKALSPSSRAGEGPARGLQRGPAPRGAAWGPLAPRA